MVNAELPRLMNNSNVTKITIIDLKTGIETVILRGKRDEDNGVYDKTNSR